MSHDQYKVVALEQDMHVEIVLNLSNLKDIEHLCETNHYYHDLCHTHQQVKDYIKSLKLQIHDAINHVIDLLDNFGMNINVNHVQLSKLKIYMDKYHILFERFEMHDDNFIVNKMCLHKSSLPTHYRIIFIYSTNTEHKSIILKTVSKTKLETLLFDLYLNNLIQLT